MFFLSIFFSFTQSQLTLCNYISNHHDICTSFSYFYHLHLDLDIVFNLGRIMVLTINSDTEMTNFCRTAGVVPSHLFLPSPDHLGYVDSISVEEIDGVTLTIATNEGGGNSTSTVILRGSKDSILDELERYVAGGVNTYKAMHSNSVTDSWDAARKLSLKLKEYADLETGFVCS
ncbi:PREDICTED: T-complex protein 1 subunit theta-like [Camelina sativa]|uniref:T-complex protein 1 subunit theta-like n=1 Tax=Camelina sativa TaxID=90675 RepID=A0ABM0W1A7_CAMSA|nr:PREDICTED: T-complex protein 1 subunit theta-like [Camelina sativa]